MPAKKLPWRTLVTSEGPAGRFTREQIRNAIIAVERERTNQRPHGRSTRHSSPRPRPPR
jgi:hypothetical protein